MRRFLISLLAVALVLLGTLLGLLLPSSCPVTRAAFERIKPGMTRAEVEGILGGPAGDYSTRPVTFLFVVEGGGGSMVVGSPSVTRPVYADETIEEWLGNEGVVFTHFLADGRVYELWFVERTSTSIGLIDLLRWRLERLKNRWFP
jgi:hypothetical protein